MNDEAAAQPRPPAALVYVLGTLGGVAGLVAALWQEVRHGPALLLMVLVAPAIEEICKPIGLVFMLDKRPGWLRSPAQVVTLAVLGAFVFATLENLLYIYVYHPGGGAGFVIWRFGVCTAMHVVASLVMGLGLAKMWKHIRSQGGHFDIDVCFRYYVAAVAIHAGFNSIVVGLQWTGLLEF